MKCDMILLLFDLHKLDISDEFNWVISSLKDHQDEIHVVLNKADQVDMQQVRYEVINTQHTAFSLFFSTSQDVTTWC